LHIFLCQQQFQREEFFDVEFVSILILSQDRVPREELLEALYLEFVNRTNEVGVDINLAVLRSNTSSLLQFVCGLGPRKGQALLKILKQNNQRVENRMQLVTACHMRPKVFMNCAGFIKIDTKSLGDR
jgi:transcription elongation factor SPT6